MSTELDIRDVIRQSIPSTDKTGTLFRHDGKLFRAVSLDLAERLRFVRKQESLFELGLCRFEESALTVKGYAAVFEISQIPVPALPGEWPTRMIQEAAQLIVRLAMALAEFGLGLHDAHPWNVLFDGTRPIFVDLGSLKAGPTLSRQWLEEFRRHLLLPLSLHSIGLHSVADAIMAEHLGTLKKLVDAKALRYLVPPKSAWWTLKALAGHADTLPKLLAHIESLDSRGKLMPWSNYGSEEIVLGDRLAYTAKHASVDQFLSRLRPGRVLDLACNDGWFSRLAVAHNNSVTGVDIDDRALGVLYDRTAREGADILPLRMDVTRPTGSYGVGLAFPDAYTRLSGDTVMAIALVHHLARNQGIRFPLLAQILNRLGRNAAIVEFIPREDTFVKRWPLAQEPWYSAEALEESMSAYFSKCTVLDSAPAPRRMYLFER